MQQNNNNNNNYNTEQIKLKTKLNFLNNKQTINLI